MLEKLKNLKLNFLFLIREKLEDILDRLPEPPAEAEEEDMIAEFILSHSEKRIRPETMEAFRERTEEDVIVLAHLPGGDLIGVSACSSKSEFSFTVVHKEFRSKGVGTALAALKKDILSSHGVVYESWVARDNAASKKMMEKLGMEKVEEQKRIRGEGRVYTALKYR